MNLEDEDWTIGHDGHNIDKVFSGKNAVAAVYGLPLHTALDQLDREKYAEGLAVAQLIAAAPLMLRALNAMKRARGNCGASPLEQAACDLMDAAIAFATLPDRKGVG